MSKHILTKEKMRAFIDYLNKRFSEHGLEYQYSDRGYRYYRVSLTYYKQKHVFCFIAKGATKRKRSGMAEAGDILKAHGWTHPTPGARGSVFSPETWDDLTMYGPPDKR